MDEGRGSHIRVTANRRRVAGEVSQASFAKMFKGHLGTSRVIGGDASEPIALGDHDPDIHHR
jgi:hypothetical protein